MTMGKRFLGRPDQDNTVTAVMGDSHLIAACNALGIPLTKKQASKWMRKEGAAYKYAMGIKDLNIDAEKKEQAIKNLSSKKG